MDFVISSNEVNETKKKQQSGQLDCGLSSTAFGTALILARQPGEFTFDQREMRSHLIHCLERRKVTKFPITKLRRVAAKTKPMEHIKVYCVTIYKLVVDLVFHL